MGRSTRTRTSRRSMGRSTRTRTSRRSMWSCTRTRARALRRTRTGTPTKSQPKNPRWQTCMRTIITTHADWDTYKKPTEKPTMADVYENDQNDAQAPREQLVRRHKKHRHKKHRAHHRARKFVNLVNH